MPYQESVLMKIDTFIQTSKEHFNLDALEHETLENLKQTFISLDYSEKTVYETLGIPHLGIVSLSYLPVLLDFKLAPPTPLKTLMKLFLFSQTFAEKELLKDLFTKKDLEACVRMKILEWQGPLIRAAINFYPCLGHYIATDQRYPDYKFPYAVMYLGQDSYTLARGTIRKFAGKTLDLCTGSGVQAILASGHSHEVTGVDISARAINFSRFNSIFNKTGNVTFIKGDLLEPVPTKKFDLIIANPPFVPAPKVEIYYRDGGVNGEDQLKKILGSLDNSLTDEGTCQIFTLLVFQQEQSYMEKLQEYLGTHDYHILVLATNFIDAEFFAIDQMSDFGTFDEYRKKLAEWLKSFYDNRIYQMADGIITIARAHKGVSPVHRLVKCRNLSKTYSKEVESYFHTLCTCQDEKELAAWIPAVRSMVKSIWKECLLKTHATYKVLFADDDLSLQADIDEDEFRILQLCDGHRSMEEIAGLYAGDGKNRKEAELLKKKCCGALQELANKWVIEFMKRGTDQNG
jgi:carbamoyltransferase